MDEIIRYSISKIETSGVKVITIKVDTRKSEEIINEVEAYWDNNHQIFLEIKECGVSRMIKISLFKKTVDYTIQSSFCEQSIDVLCKTGGSIVCQAACLALREIPIINSIFCSALCADVCTTIANEGCNWAKTKLCENKKENN
ncbi:halocin C8-like domain-containing protein [Niallia alba]|uniref:Uncharacterized protein n=1 Tax=Niallia alba TaxID=2729105 RepID=A0A7Y0K5F6_9BACI|nr:halocin C8-like domain-containing protein [Niallia alba]EOR24525.1 hypothetical protein A499_07742 [Niallia nealsonii AAU1]NMO76135.1 hypothetical protein [Niallia alba]